jgi:hypothetical protein
VSATYTQCLWYTHTITRSSNQSESTWHINAYANLTPTLSIATCWGKSLCSIYKASARWVCAASTESQCMWLHYRHSDRVMVTVSAWCQRPRHGHSVRNERSKTHFYSHSHSIIYPENQQKSEGLDSDCQNQIHKGRGYCKESFRTILLQNSLQCPLETWKHRHLSLSQCNTFTNLFSSKHIPEATFLTRSYIHTYKYTHT